MTHSRQKNDCVIVAISNATGMSYDEVAAKLPTPKATRSNKGIQTRDWITFIESLGWIELKTIPRRGQDKITGIVRMISTKKVTGHLVYMQDGIVYDHLAINGLPLKVYQMQTTKKHISRIWVKPLIDISRQVVDTVDTEVSLDFLRSLAD